MKPNNVEYYQYILLYTGNILAVMEEPKRFLEEELSKHFTLKENSIGKPKQYLGNKVSQVKLDNGTKCWSFGPSQYIQAAVKNIKKYLKEHNLNLLPKTKPRWSYNYRPEADITDELGPERSLYYQSIIRVLGWVVKLGQGDLAMEMSIMRSVVSLPREGHLKTVFRMFLYMESHYNGVTVFNLSKLDIDLGQFPREDWLATPYGPCTEDVPSNAPPPRGVGFTM